MKKIGLVLSCAVLVIYSLFWIGCCLLNLFFSYVPYSCKKTFLFSNLQLLLFGLLSVILFWIFSYWLSQKNFSLSFPKCDINILTLILFVVQAYVFYNTYFYTNQWDPAAIYGNAEIISRGATEGLNHFYFSRYPNNIGIVCFQSILLRLNRISGVWDPEGHFLMILVQCLLSSWTGKLLYDTVCRLTDSGKYALLSWLFYIVLLGLSGWNIITYTDMMSLIFPIAIFSVYLSLQNEKRILLKWIVIIGLTYWGSLIKPTVAIIFLALLITEIIQLLKHFNLETWRRKFKFFIKTAIAGGVCILLFSMGYQAAVRSTGLNINKNAYVGALHFMMMGLNPDNHGVFHKNDTLLSANITNPSERTHAQIQTIKKRLHDYGPKGFAKHIAKKSLINFNDGTFAWRCEGGFFDVIYPNKNKKAAPFLQSLYLINGSRYRYLAALEQWVWMLTLFTSIGLILIKKKAALVILLSLIGIILFHSLFEARARYLILYVPFFIMASILSLHHGEMYWQEKLQGHFF